MPWTPLAPLPYHRLAGVAPLLNGRTVVFGHHEGRPGTIFWTDTNGDTWSTLDVPVEYGTRVFARGEDRVGIFDGLRLHVTDDFITWRTIDVPSEGQVDASRVNSLRGTVVPYDVISVIRDGKESFLFLGTNHNSYTGDGYSAMYRFEEGAPKLAVIKEFEGTIDLFREYADRILVRTSVSLLMSEDGGASWTEHPKPRNGRLTPGDPPDWLRETPERFVLIADGPRSVLAFGERGTCHRWET